LVTGFVKMTTSSVSPTLADTADRMQCMEVWGGNSEVNKSFEMPGLRAWVYSKPYGKSTAGGDVYYVSSCASGRITRLLLADVSGHGPEVAGLALGLRDLMRRNVNLVKQTRFVEGMNRQFTRLSESGAFATALVATFFQPTRKLTLCNAGHPPPLLFQARANRWSTLEPDERPEIGISGTPLGVYDQARYPQVQLPLEHGDLVLLYSDAVTESLDSSGTMVGVGGLVQLVKRLDTSDPSGFIDSLLAAIGGNRSGSLDHDDLTMILVRASGTSTTWRDNFLAPFRLLRAVGDSTTLK
jgi:phosphoserine phosphatase RsbU/P